MKPEPEMEARGLKAYEQVCAFEALRRKKLPLIYAGFTALTAAVGALLVVFQQASLGVCVLICAACFGLGSNWNWSRQRMRYEANLIVVNDMEKTYGDELPWVKVEKHFEALAKLQRELAMEKQAQEE